MKKFLDMLEEFPTDPDKDTWEKRIRVLKEKIRLFKEQEESKRSEEAKERED